MNLPRPERFTSIGEEIGKLLAKKNAAYGDSFNQTGEVMRLLYPNGIPLDKVADALAIVRIYDKLKRIATDRDALGEDPWRDIAGYAILSLERIEREKQEKAYQADMAREK